MKPGDLIRANALFHPNIAGSLGIIIAQVDGGIHTSYFVMWVYVAPAIDLSIAGWRNHMSRSCYYSYSQAYLEKV